MDGSTKPNRNRVVNRRTVNTNEIELFKNCSYLIFCIDFQNYGKSQIVELITVFNNFSFRNNVIVNNTDWSTSFNSDTHMYTCYNVSNAIYITAFDIA